MPFDATKTGIPFYDMMLANPDYFLKNKGLVGKVVYMSPDEYIAKAVECMGTTTVQRFVQVVDENFISRYANYMWVGVKFDMPVIECHRGYTEGRHRALAAKKIGVKQMPVFIVEKATDLPTYQPAHQSTHQPAVREAAPKTVFKRAGKLEIHPLLVQAFGITPEEIVETINASEEPEAMRDMFVFLSDYAALSDPRTRLSVSGDKLDFMVADLKRRMGRVAEFYREQAIEYGKLGRFMEYVKVRKLQMADRLQRISEEARKLSAFSGQTRTDKIAFIDAVIHLEHTSGSVIPIAFGITDYGREDYWPRKLLAFLRAHGMPGMVKEGMAMETLTPEREPWQMTQQEYVQKHAPNFKRFLIENKAEGTAGEKFYIWSDTLGDWIIRWSRTKPTYSLYLNTKLISDPRTLEDAVKIRVALVHKSMVQQAFIEGKPVPPEVLAEYPYSRSIVGGVPMIRESVAPVPSPAKPWEMSTKRVCESTEKEPWKRDYEQIEAFLRHSEVRIVEGAKAFREGIKALYPLLIKMPEKEANELRKKILDMDNLAFETLSTGISKTSEPINKEFKANPNLINKELAMRSHSGTSWDPEKRGVQEIEGFVAYVQEIYDRLSKHAKTDRQKEYLLTEMGRFQSTFASKYNDKLSSQGSCMSAMIAGPSKFPTGRAQKACSAADKKYEELIEFRDRAEAAILRELKKMGVEEAGGEVAVLKNKIAQAEKLQEMMVEGNKIVRKKAEPGIGGVSKQQQLINLGFTEKTAMEALKPDYMGRFGFPAFALQNNSANIRRMKERVIELEKKEATPSGDIIFEGGTIHDSKEDDRIQIFFDQKPLQAMIDKLKSEGWRWAPSVGAWSRKRTDAALYSARRILGLEAQKPIFVPVKEEPKIDEEVHARIQVIIDIMKIYRDKGMSFEELETGLKGMYLVPSGYERNGAIDAVKLLDDLNKSGYNNLRDLWRKIIVQAPEKEIPTPPTPTRITSIPLLYPAPQPQSVPELRWVYGTQDMVWHLVGHEDRDYAHGITQERMRQIGQEAAKAEYLNPALARAEAPVPLLSPAPEYPEVKKYTTPRFFIKGTIARNNLNEKFVLEHDVEALQQDKSAKIWKTSDGIYIYTDDQLPAPTPPKPIIITLEDERLLKGYENYTDDAIQKRILLNEGKLKVLAARKLERIEQGKYGTMGSAYIEQERLGISQENSTFMRVLELRKLKAAEARIEPWKLTQEEYWRAGAGGKAYEGRGTSDYTHKGQVVLALAQGKPVSPVVLKDYPDIVARIRKENEAIIAKERAERERIKAIERIEENELNAELNRLPPPLKRHAETEIYSTLHLPETHKDYRNRFYIALGKVRRIAFTHLPGEKELQPPVQPQVLPEVRKEEPVEPLLPEQERVLKAYLEGRGYELKLQDFIWADKYTIRGTAKYAIRSMEEKRRREEFILKNYNEETGKKFHRGTVISALERGIKVPDEVLKDYPDLMKKEVPEPTGYFTLRKAQELTRENNSKLSDEQLHKKSIQLRDYIRFIETPDEYSRKTLVKGGYYAGVIDQYVTGMVPVDPFLHQNLKSTLDEVYKEQQRRKLEKEKISVPTVPIAKPVTGKFVQTTFQVQERMRRYGYA